MSLAYEAAFQVHPNAKTSAIRNNVTENFDFDPPSIARSYPVSMQQEVESCKQVLGIPGNPYGHVLHLGRSLHMMTLQLIKLLTEIKYHQGVFKVLRELLFLLKPPEDKGLSTKVENKSTGDASP